MTANKLIRNPLWATLLAALVAAMVSFFVFVQGGAAAQVANQKTYEPLIINGEPVPNGKYPFIAALIDQSRQEPITNKQFCGGTLIDKTHVLTAGHCVLAAQPNGPPQLDPKLQDIKVFIGRTVLTSDQGEERRVKDIDVHPKYPGNPGPKDLPGNQQSYDVAVLTLDRAVKGIKPIELATSMQNNLEKRHHATIAGWGDIDPDPQNVEKPDRMQEAQVPILSDSRADKLVEQQLSDTPNFDFVPPLMIGTGDHASVCQGDSGGPLFVRTSGDGDKGDNGNGGSGGNYTQIGITSFVSKKCNPPNVSVFTEVNAKPIASFIKRVADNGDGDDNDDK